VVVAADSEGVAPAVTGKRPMLLKRRDRRSINRAVAEAESHAGLQFCVYLGPAEADTRKQAEELFVNAGLQELPAVLVLVAPDRKKVELLTAPSVRERLPDEDCERVIGEMTQYFARDQFVDGLLVGVGLLAELAGPGTAAAGSTDLPNVIE
jgi:hypothetical protein